MRKKLKLDLDSLEVQSFATADAPEGRGTVRGHGGQPCTYWGSCACATGYWDCTTSRETQQSCDYTRAGDTCDSFPTEVDPSCMCA